ncbi:hypothetical protein DPMN_167806 [Dreissena polymorpha]|uniref:Uncharacterized protein n=1 Tax=Dreissena polymorpha TaxID=45954 RepID=A0A9D4IVC4_DREPO|nr:hypothetical protein DPMN_167806 [Dreissena polymorpha]
MEFSIGGLLGRRGRMPAVGRVGSVATAHVHSCTGHLWSPSELAVAFDFLCACFLVGLRQFNKQLTDCNLYKKRK